jgi:hypothetical protein
MREDPECDLQVLVTGSTLRQAESSHPHSPIPPLIVEGARSALRPRGASGSCPRVSGVRPALWDLPVVRSRTRLLFATLPRGRASRVGLRGAPAPSTESGRPTRSSRSSAGVSSAPRDGSEFPPHPSIRQTRTGGAGRAPAYHPAPLHRLWPVACGAARAGSPGPTREAAVMSLHRCRWSWNFIS